MLNITNHDDIREIKLAKPPVNALNTDLVRGLTDKLREAQTECKSVVISGQDGVFSAGLDVVELMQLDREGMTVFWDAFFELLETVACSEIPIAAAITGHSPAGGAVICLLCDYRVMSRGDYGIGLNETRVGLVIPPILQNAMARLVGPRTAEHMLVTGAMINPEDALRTGFVDALESGYEATTEHALQWCRDLLLLPQHSMLGNRAIARAHFKKEFSASTAESIKSFVDGWFSAETQYVMNSLVAQLKSKN